MPEGTEDRLAQIAPLLARERHMPLPRRMVDRVKDQTEKAVNEVFPPPRFGVETRFEKWVVDFKNT